MNYYYFVEFFAEFKLLLLTINIIDIILIITSENIPCLH
jgi:hypothetical protein